MPSTARPDRTIRYGAGETGVIDVWSPTAPGRGVTVALVHGGFWKAQWDRHHLEPLAAALAAHGFAVASLEYPRVGMPGGGWPGTCAAVAAGLGAVAADPKLPSSVVAVGHSAGGHLVTWAASQPDPIVPPVTPPASRPDPIVPPVTRQLTGVVALAGVVDLGLAARVGLGGDAAQAFMGKDTNDEEWAAADPARLRLAVPTVLLTGDDDEDVPHAVSESYLATRTDDDATCELRLLPGVGHMDLVDPDHPAYDELVRAIDDLTPETG